MQTPSFLTDDPKKVKGTFLFNNYTNRGQNNFWHTEYNGELNQHQKQLKKLAEKILSFAGHQVIMPSIEDDLDKIQQRGLFCDGKHSIIKKGLPSQCHRNSCDLYEYENRKDFFIMTGYALSDDGYWYQHSWCIDYKNNHIIETTEPRLAYFGFVMTHDECDDFCFDNF